jgi:hypothetical protein
MYIQAAIVKIERGERNKDESDYTGPLHRAAQTCTCLHA